MYAAEKDYWKDFAKDAGRMGSPLYEQLSLAVDGDAGLKALAARVRPGQPHPNLLFAAVHYLLLRGADHPLRNVYPSLGGRWSGENIFPLFQDFVATHHDDVRRLIESRVTNTNEVARSTVLRAGFAALARHESAPVHLIEIGPSAGLNMIWDRYGMRYRRDGETVVEIAPDAPLVLDCELRGTGMPPLTPVPLIAGRVGLELNPVDLARGEDRDWLRAVIWPDQPERLARLDRAIALFLQSPAPILSGDALALLPDALAAVPRDKAMCVYHSIALYQFSAGGQEAFAAILALAGLRRPVWHLAFEFDGEDHNALNLTHHHDGAMRREKLAVAHAHGGWLEWRGPA